MARRGRPQGSRNPNPKVPYEDYPVIVERLKAGETQVAIAKEYGVTRAFISLIANRLGYSTLEAKSKRLRQKVLDAAPDIIWQRQQWRPIRFPEWGIDQIVFEGILKQYAPALYAQWQEARKLPFTRIGRQAPDYGQVCCSCFIFQPWDQFYKQKTKRTGLADRCKTCAYEQMYHYYKQRHVPKPTVTERRCSNCRIRKPASAFHRMTHNNSGLQSWCKDCQDQYRRST